MSDLMLHGVLNIPLPNDPAECDIVTWAQFKARARQASRRIKELEAKEAKAVKFLEFLDANYRHVFGDTARAKFAQLYAEMKGQTDD